MEVLLLSYVRVVEGESHADSIDRTIDRLKRLQVPVTELMDKLSRLGYVYDDDVNSHFRFHVLEEEVFQVMQAFPGLRVDDIPPLRREAIAELSYGLSLVGAPGRLGPEDIAEELRRLLDAA